MLGFISRHSLGIYGFHALVIHALRTRGVELKSWPVLDIVWIFSVTLVVSLLLSMLLQKQTPAASSVNDALSGPMKLAREENPAASEACSTPRPCIAIAPPPPDAAAPVIANAYPQMRLEKTG